ncbi:carboxylic ester hydrolase-like [Xylocopa sonorina]|uniref:carboxylic ester hydrolase-like n=1 Tax=Xylocopa sonorina TaxID=1818115 RepID=UPI00403AD8F6
MWRTLYLGALSLLGATDCVRLTEVVQTTKGPVRGRIFETQWNNYLYSSFRGIPYARPPIGALRFIDPIEPDSWTEVRNATDNPPICAQYVLLRVIGQENCLYLNVYTPHVSYNGHQNLKPVILYIYGALYIGGSSLSGIYGADFFLEEDVVLVTFNYRADILGYLALDLPNVQGNQALKDQNMVLRWVQKNIAAFGGDPNRVTLMGQGAGGAAVGYHLLSPRSKGLFHQAVLQSGSPLSPWAYRTRRSAYEYARQTGRLLGLSTQNQEELLKGLQKTSLENILSATQRQIRWYLPIIEIYYLKGPMDLTQNYLTKHDKENVYFYQLSYDSPYNLHKLIDNKANGVAYGDDIGFLFNVQVVYPTDPSNPFNVYRKKMVSMWANFAKYRNPTPNKKPINGAVWMPSGTAGSQLDINGTNKMNKRLLGLFGGIIQKIYNHHLPYSTECKYPAKVSKLSLIFEML